MKLTPVHPFEPISTEQLPEGDRWIAQIKWDGVRIMAYFDGQDSRLINRKGNERTLQYPEFSDVTQYCTASSVILDGEMIAIEDKKPSFHAIMKRDGLRKQSELARGPRIISPTFMLFDILYCDGKWVTDQSLEARQKLLEQVIKPNDHLQLCQNFPDAAGLFEIMKNHGWEGVVCKDLDSKYAIAGKDKRWQKMKIFRDLYAVVGGVTYRDGIVNALLLGLYDDDGKFLYIGHAGAGCFTAGDWRFLTKEAERLRVPQRPFYNIPQRVKGAAWMLPSLTVKVEYMEWTNGGTLRHPVLQSLAAVPPETCLISQA